MCNNQLETLSLNLACLTSLEELNLSNNKLTEIIFEGGSGGVLKKLSLQNNELIDKDGIRNIWTQIQNLTNLKELYLYGNKLKKLPSVDKRNIIKALDLFHLYDNDFSKNVVENLKEIFSWEKTKKGTLRKQKEKLDLIRKLVVYNKEITDKKISEILASIHRSEEFIMDRISSNLTGIINF